MLCLLTRSLLVLNWNNWSKFSLSVVQEFDVVPWEVDGLGVVTEGDIVIAGIEVDELVSAAVVYTRPVDEEAVADIDVFGAGS